MLLLLLCINNASDVLIFICSGLHNIYFTFFNHNLWQLR